MADVGYFNKHTTNGYDFGALFDTPIFFPVSWDHSKLDGIIGRVTLVEHRGFSASMVFGHTNAIFSPPGTGGILTEAPPGDFRIDHDQKFQQTTNAQYVFDKAHGSVGGDLVALRLRPRGRVSPRLRHCPDADGRPAGGDRPLLRRDLRRAGRHRSPSCGDPNRGATRLHIPADGTEDE